MKGYFEFVLESEFQKKLRPMAMLKRVALGRKWGRRELTNVSF